MSLRIGSQRIGSQRIGGQQIGSQRIIPGQPLPILPILCSSFLSSSSPDSLLPIRCLPIWCLPIRCLPIRCLPIHCLPIRCLPIRCLPAPHASREKSHAWGARSRQIFWPTVRAHKVGRKMGVKPSPPTVGGKFLKARMAPHSAPRMLVPPWGGVFKASVIPKFAVQVSGSPSIWRG